MDQQKKNSKGERLLKLENITYEKYVFLRSSRADQIHEYQGVKNFTLMTG